VPFWWYGDGGKRFRYRGGYFCKGRLHLSIADAVFFAEIAEVKAEGGESVWLARLLLCFGGD